MPGNKSLNIFISYSNNTTDKSLLQKLVAMMSTLRDNYSLDIWYDSRIKASRDWNDEIKERLEKAHIFFLLLSPDFFNSEYIKEIELPKILERKRQNNCHVVPILLSPCGWEDDKRISKINMVPKNERSGKILAISSWTNKGEAFFEVYKKVKELIEDEYFLQDFDQLGSIKEVDLVSEDNLKNIWGSLPLQSTRDQIKLYDCDRVEEFAYLLVADFFQHVAEDKNLYYFLPGCATQRPEFLVNRLIMEEGLDFDRTFVKDLEPEPLHIGPYKEKTWANFLTVFFNCLPQQIHTGGGRSEDFDLFINRDIPDFIPKGEHKRFPVVFRILESEWKYEVEKHLYYIAEQFSSQLPAGYHRFAFFFIIEIADLHKFYKQEDHVAYNRFQRIRKLCEEPYAECECIPHFKDIPLLNGVPVADVKTWIRGIIDRKKCKDKTLDDYVDLVLECLISGLKEQDRDYYHTHHCFNMDRLAIMQGHAFQYLTR